MCWQFDRTTTKLIPKISTENTATKVDRKFHNKYHNVNKHMVPN